VAVRLILALVASALASGCLPPRRVGHFAENGFYHTRDHYRVRYVEGGQRLLGPDWALENFDADDDGRPLHASGDPRWYEGHDLRTFGVRRGRLVTTERWDLRFTHADTGHVIFARSIPLRPVWAGYDLPSLLRLSVHAIQARYEGAPDLLGTGATAPSFVRVITEGDARVDGQRARFVTFDQQVGAATRRVTVVALRPGRATWNVRRWRLPMMVVFGFVSGTEDHRGPRADFESLVSRVDLRL